MTNLDQLFREVASAQEGLPETAVRIAVVRRRISMMGSSRGRVRTPPWKVLVWAAGLGATAAAGVALYWGRQGQPITVALGESGTTVSSGAWLDAPATSSLPLRFSDGSKVEVAPHAKIRVLELERQGAKLALESGRAGVDVAHGENRHWELRAGPFVVRVTGTRFDVSWQPKDDQFELILNEGQVEIAGCGFGEGRRLVAGQNVHASCRDGTVDVAYSAAMTSGSGASGQNAAAPATAPIESSSNSPAAQLALPAAKLQGSGTPRTATALPEALDWRSLAREGKYADAMAAAERVGFDVECTRADASGLALLGEAAVRAHQPSRALQAWVILRKRFVGTSQSAVAAFSLGVLEFDQWHANAKAADWFRTYIRENPKGPLSREARGRLMEALQSSGGDEVRALAKDYLRDYPVGPHAALAQRLVKSP